ncbi:hypothetical protein [Fischerella sp. PCC 9605]|uniref:hypothetical protein n=1 Tax=Fischerella sp. PCC 9605 TaxID=1173024 RepID=UPI0004B887DC|nr:hypothetical protein [Fischerella sp. PCC 9605]
MKTILIFAFVIIVLLGLLLTPSSILTQAQKQVSPRQNIEQVKEQNESELMAIDGVVGVGISECEGAPCIKVYLENEFPKLKKQIPTQLDGFKVDTEVTGSIEALPQQQ